jgi:hypothetical protein
MIYEHKKEKLASKRLYRKRVGFNALIAFFVLAFSLGIGVLGYQMTIPQFDWYDSLLNASMILSGMGPVVDAEIHLSNSAKLFASFYALFSGISFLSTFGILIAPILHRFFHRLHLESDDRA